MRRTTGSYLEVSTLGEAVRAYVPAALPPEPPLVLSEADRELLSAAQEQLKRLDAVASVLPDVSLLIYPYVRKEAVVSSQIEGTQSSFADLLLYESDQAPGVPLEDAREVSHYVAALQHGLERMRSGFPLSGRLLREIHGILLRDGRGATQLPGEFRRTQVWVGGSRPRNAAFVPPPPGLVPDLIAALERFLNAQAGQSEPGGAVDAAEPRDPLLRAALAHVQFETIHPFLDGNGRTGRLLITLMLCGESAMSSPLLYLSLYFKKNRPAYYAHLQAVRKDGAWEEWVRFFLQGVVETATDAAETSRRILTLFEDDRRRLAGLGRGAASALAVHEELKRKPITHVRALQAALGLTYPTVAAALQKMVALGMVRELTGYRRNRVFSYDSFVEILSSGTEPL